MYNASFYPTPPEVAEKMLAKVGKLYERSILEPSAGKGDLADAAVGKLDRYYNRCREVVHCIEIEPELQAAIRGKGYPLVGTDFLTFWPDEKYDLILMNPPFASGFAPQANARPLPSAPVGPLDGQRSGDVMRFSTSGLCCRRGRKPSWPNPLWG